MRGALEEARGAENARLWSVSAGELGNYVLVLEFENAADYAKVTDPLVNAPTLTLSARQRRNSGSGDSGSEATSCVNSRWGEPAPD
jgi:hypothetical protein